MNGIIHQFKPVDYVTHIKNVDATVSMLYTIKKLGIMEFVNIRIGDNKIYVLWSDEGDWDE